MQIAFFCAIEKGENLHHLRLAELMIRSAKKHMPNVKFIQLTDESTAWVEGADECRRLSKDEPLMPFRLKHYSLMEGDTIFVDTDIMFNANVSDVFDNNFDICLTHRRGEIIVAPTEDGNFVDIVDKMPFNTGVIFSRRPQFWKEAYDYCKTLDTDKQEWYGDQLAVKHIFDRNEHDFFYQLMEVPCSIYNYTPLTKEENITDKKIIHFKGERKGWMMLDKFEIIGGVEVPKFNTYSVVDNSDRHKNMELAIALGFPHLEQVPFHERSISIACYGPSLQDTWQELKQPIISVSGAHDFLISKGIIPTYHVDCDPREYKADFVKIPHKEVTYLMASCQHPKTWEYLQGQNVKLWHLYNGQETTRWMRKNNPKGFTVCGGSTIGLRAIEIAGVLGFKTIDIHGMDSSFKYDQRHAGPHGGTEQKKIRVKIGEKWYPSTPQMVEAARESVSSMTRYATAGVSFNLFGDGLIQEMMANVLKKNIDFKVAA